MGTETIVAVGCDGTNVNTGSLVEQAASSHSSESWSWNSQSLCSGLSASCIRMDYHCDICLNVWIDGVTAGPRAFTGPVGKSMANCEQLPVALFAKKEVDFPEDTANDLSTDSKHLLDICEEAIIEDNCSNSLTRRNPGAMSHSRWLTTAIIEFWVFIDLLQVNSHKKTLAT